MSQEPPTTQDDDGGGSPAETTGDEVVIPGDSPHTPPSDAATITEPGGSPTDEILQLHDPSITTLAPDTAVVGGEATVTVTGTNFRDDSVVEVDQSPVSTVYVSATELTATLDDPGAAGTASVTVRNPTSQMESNSVEFTWTAAGNLRTGNIREDSK